MLAAGTEIGSYRIESVLGRGGMGVVYEATQLSLGRTVALKLLDAALTDDESFRERFRMEGRVQARLDHPNIIPVYEAGELPEGLFIAMRLIRGPNLKQLVRQQADLGPARILRLLEPVADALDTAHEAGLTHRDVKPQNILVDRRDHAYLADFGITKPAGATGLTRSGYVMGTLDYLSPEQIRGERATSASDIYAFAAMAYECLVGRVPFPKDSEAAVMFAHVSEAPPRASTQAGGLGAAVDDVLAAGMAKDPAERPATATELMQRLRTALGDPDRDATPSAGLWPAPPGEAGVPTASVEIRGEETRMDPLREPPPEPEAEPEPRIRRGVLAGAGTLAAVAGLAIGLVLAGSGGEPPPPEPEKVSSGPIGFTAPGGWTQAAEPVDIAGLDLQAATAALAPTGQKGTVVAGFTKGSGATLLPEPFRKKLENPPEAGERVRLGKVDALRFDRLTPKKGEPLRVFTSLTDKGVATVACVGVAETDVCDGMAASLVLEDVEPKSLDPDSKYGRAVRRVVERLGKARDRELKALRAAKTPAAQALAAAAVSRAYASATKSVGEKIEPGAREIEVHREMFDAFRDGAIAYVALANSAAKGGGAWKKARAKAERADAAARRAVRGLETLGFEVR